jgi:hypothetical protein
LPKCGELLGLRIDLREVVAVLEALRPLLARSTQPRMPKRSEIGEIFSVHAAQLKSDGDSDPAKQVMKRQSVSRDGGRGEDALRSQERIYIYSHFAFFGAEDLVRWPAAHFHSSTCISQFSASSASSARFFLSLAVAVAASHVRLGRQGNLDQ